MGDGLVAVSSTSIDFFSISSKPTEPLQRKSHNLIFYMSSTQIQLLMSLPKQITCTSTVLAVKVGPPIQFRRTHLSMWGLIQSSPYPLPGLVSHHTRNTTKHVPNIICYELIHRTAYNT